MNTDEHGWGNQMGEMRFAVLLHEGYGERHWDLFLEVEGKERLMAWHVLRGPEEWGRVGEEALKVERIGDHRKIYLEYEGEVSGARGRVRRVERGTVRVVEVTGKGVRVRLKGEMVDCEMVLPIGGIENEK